ncbi:MAG: hypothetical protein HOO96_38755 [Polyangiaceae bacterium]|nr:hypothetical protein [Polyangiaceae bacterium]
MSFQEEWVLPQPVESYSDEDLLGRVRALLPEGTSVEVSGDPDCRTIRVDFQVADVDAIAEKLATRPGQLDWEWREDFDPPRGGGQDYNVHVDIVDDERPILRIYSNDGENRQAWPLVCAIASSLAEELGGIPEDEAPPPSDHIPMFIEPKKVQKPN